jgi:hypothetical protein
MESVVGSLLSLSIPLALSYPGVIKGGYLRECRGPMTSSDPCCLRDFDNLALVKEPFRVSMQFFPRKGCK